MANMAESRTDWRKIIQSFCRICGYGDSDKPTVYPAHRTYSKRTMAQDIVMLNTPAFPFCLRRAMIVADAMRSRWTSPDQHLL